MMSASALPRLLKCAGSAALPQANTTSEWAEAGTERHAEQEDAVNAGNVPDDVRALVGDDVLIRAEVALAYDIATGGGRELGVGKNRDYSGLGPFEVPGTADLLAVAADRVIVIDAKGWEDVDAAERNAQLALLALAAARAHGKEEALVAILYLRGDHRDLRDRAVLDAFDLDAFAQRLAGLHAAVAEQRARRARGELVDVAEGAHCKYCPAAHACPAKVALLQRLVRGTEADELELMLPLTPATARDAYERLQAGKGLLKRIERALYAYAANDPIPLGNGRFFGKHRELGNEKLDGPTVHDVVREKLGEAAALRAVTLSTTKKRLGEAIKSIALQGTASAIERDVLAEVRSRGGAKREETESVGEYEAEPMLVPNNGKELAS